MKVPSTKIAKIMSLTFLSIFIILSIIIAVPMYVNFIFIIPEVILEGKGQISWVGIIVFILMLLISLIIYIKNSYHFQFKAKLIYLFVSLHLATVSSSFVWLLRENTELSRGDEAFRIVKEWLMIPYISFPNIWKEYFLAGKYHLFSIATLCYLIYFGVVIAVYRYLISKRKWYIKCLYILLVIHLFLSLLFITWLFMSWVPIDPPH